MAVKGYRAMTILPPVTLGLLMIPPVEVMALRTSLLTSFLAAAAATASAATMTEAGKGGTGSLFDWRGVHVMGSQPGALRLESPQHIQRPADHWHGWYLSERELFDLKLRIELEIGKCKYLVQF